uniref:Uncharacterized protein MANES_05G137000 n=1 Tax=Rhizophora mucronata TaxID=61149 RepID=A0A2P2JXU1_RHIMU
MDHIAAMEQQMVSERMRRKLNEVNAAAQSHLSPVQDHINFTLQVRMFCVFMFEFWECVCTSLCSILGSLALYLLWVFFSF